jgi:hypothetical protein
MKGGDDLSFRSSVILDKVNLKTTKKTPLGIKNKKQKLRGP